MPAPKTPAELAALGVYNFATLAPVLSEQPLWLVEGLMRTPGVHMAIGESNLGKTPLFLMLALAVATGTPWLGRPTRQGRVLYCDEESHVQDLHTMTDTLSRFLGLPAPPADLFFWSPHLEEGLTIAASTRLLQHVRDVQPSLVIVDPLRGFFPEADQQNNFASQMIRSFRTCRTAVLIVHHMRKTNQNVTPPSLVTEPMRWLQEAAGARGLINHTDTRFGLEACTKGGAELLIGGVVRKQGPIAAFHVGRAYEENSQGDLSPIGYTLATGLSFLSVKDAATYTSLPNPFRFKDLQATQGPSGANAKRFLKLCESHGLLHSTPLGYVKTPAA